MIVVGLPDTHQDKRVVIGARAVKGGVESLAGLRVFPQLEIGIANAGQYPTRFLIIRLGFGDQQPGLVE